MFRAIEPSYSINNIQGGDLPILEGYFVIFRVYGT